MVGIDMLGYLSDLLVWYIFVVQPYVALYVSGKEEDILKDCGDISTQVANFVLPDVNTVYE
jgi:hypothetical protein